jgi:hypothetical protein
MVAEAAARIEHQLRLVRTPEMRLLLLLQALRWGEVEAKVIAACRRTAGLSKER